MTEHVLSPAQGKVDAITPAAFAVAIFTSASLVFVVQPMTTKLVLPLLGPSNFRDTTGIAAEAFGDPVNLWAANTDRDGITLGRAIAGGIDTRSRLIEPIDDLRRNSLDYYASLRSLYRQNRISEINDGRTTAEEYPEFPEFPEDEAPPVDNSGGTSKSSTP